MNAKYEEIKELFDKVQKPGRYIGKEINSVTKTFSEDKVKVALSYPDLYEIGMSYLGLKIIYHLLNSIDNVLCERVFMPAEDMERELIEKEMKLFSLESRESLDKFDIMGFSLSYELTYTNVLSILDLGGIEIFSKNRNENSPFVVAGGTCAYNPEPMSSFIDVFLLGDAEELFPLFIEKYRELKQKGTGRQEMLRHFARLPGVYVPALYETHFPGARPRPIDPDLAEDIVPARVKDLENAFYPVKQIVPYIKTIHDRIAVEIMRGCPNSCRFCQASAVNRPVRRRSAEKILEICKEAYENTGLESIALLSLSSINYPCLSDIITSLNRDFAGKGVAVSVPSLRVHPDFYALPEVMSVIRKAGLTFAPETADLSIMKDIGKNMDEGVLISSIKTAFEKGWRSVKLYFMVGFPFGSDNEEDKIAGLAKRISNLKGSRAKDAAEVRVSVNPFIPKPHTALQLKGMRTYEELKAKKRKMLSYGNKKIKISFHDIGQSMLEGAICRGDRRVSNVIFRAWQKGCRMDSWSEYFDFSSWSDAFQEEGLDVEKFASRELLNEELPWGHIKV